MKFKSKVFIVLDGNCREAVEYYANVFETKVRYITTFGEIPPDPNNPVLESNMDKVAFSELEIGDLTIHLWDRSSPELPYIVGNNFGLHFTIVGMEDAKKVFNKLKKGGEVLEELHETFYADLYGNTVDKFGIIWHILCHDPKD